MRDHDDLTPFEGEMLREPLRDLLDPYRRTVRDDDAREQRDDRDADPMAVLNAAYVGGG